MTADQNWKRPISRFAGDDQPVSDARTQPASGGRGHPSRGFPDRQTHHVCGPKGPHYGVAGECAVDENARIDGINAGVDDGQQI
jgi:hypothetical protein